MGDCHEYNRSGKSKEESCYQRINGNYSVQDAYNLEQDDKWNLVYDVLMNKIKCKCKNEICDKSLNDQFYKKYNDLITINFMNIAIDGDWWDYIDLTEKIIDQKAEYINKRLTDYEGNFYNYWFILDFPTTYVIRKIYLSNEFKSPVESKSKLSGVSNNNNNNNSKPLNYYKDLNIYFDSKYNIYKKIVDEKIKSNNETMLCIQRKLKNNKKNKEYAVKTNFKCINNSRNKWYFKQNNESINIISVLDNKCLLYKNNKLVMGECNNDYKNFIVNDKKICSKINNDNCLEGYELMPVPLERDEYQNLNCQKEIAELGYHCCSSSVKIDHINEIGTWGYENDELCGIPFDTLDLQENVNL